jgi:hypothetical protein
VKQSKDSNREGSSSFLEKRTKKLFLSPVRPNVACRANQQSKSFLVLYFKKELLSSSPLPEGTGPSRMILSTSPAMRAANTNPSQSLDH